MGFLDSKIKVLPNGREVLQMPDSVNFAIITKDKHLLLASQFRASNQQESLNLFGGYIEDGENFTDTLYREMLEEANISKDDVDRIHYIFLEKYVSMGYTTERNTTCIVYLNKWLRELDARCNDKDEDIKIFHTFIDKKNITKIYKKCEGLKLHLVLTYLLDALQYE